MQSTVSGTDSDGQGAWLAPREAQLVLGIGERTLFRRIQRGQLERRQRQDGRVEVWVPGARPSTTVPETDIDGQAPVAQAEQALAVVDRLNQAVAQQVAPLLAELATTRQELVRYAQENGRLAEENRHLQERLAALEARPSATVSSTVNDRQGAAAAPWWSWLWPWRRA